MKASRSSLTKKQKMYRWIVLVVVVIVIGVVLLSSTKVDCHSEPSPLDIRSEERLSGSLTWSATSLLPNDTCDTTHLKPWNRGTLTALSPAIAKDCELLKQHNGAEIDSVTTALKNWKNSESLDEWKNRMSNCTAVVEDFSNNFYVSQEELDFPIAFSLVFYNNPQQIVRLLKAIYRPHNLYCIHADARQGEEFADIFRGISGCLGNVFVASRLEEVYYEHHTILDAQLNCLRDLRKFNSSRWKYTINLCGKELPLKTNREIVSSLRTLNGVSGVEAIPLEDEEASDSRYRFKWKVFLDKTFTGKVLYNFLPLGPPPHGLKIYKGQTHVAASRPYVDFLLGSTIAKDFLKYLQNVKVPEEHFYASLYHSANASAVGGYKKNVSVPFVNLLAWLKKDMNFKCEGYNVHNICIVTVADISEIYRFLVNDKQEYFFHNKYFMERDHVVMDCMEEQLLQRNQVEYQKDCTDD